MNRAEAHVVPLSGRELATAIRLLGLLQDHLESAIDGETIEGKDPKDPDIKNQLARDRRNWKHAEGLVKKFDAIRRSAKK